LHLTNPVDVNLIFQRAARQIKFSWLNFQAGAIFKIPNWEVKMRTKFFFRQVAIGWALIFFFSSGVMTFNVDVFSPTDAMAKKAKKSDEFIAKGKLKGFSLKAKMITLDQKGKGFCFIKFTDQTNFQNLKLNKIKPGAKIKVKYKKKGGENIAIKVEKLLVKLPEGITEIKTDELQALIQNKKTFTLVDARPPQKFKENHIKGAISIPYSKLKKVAKNKEKGMKYFPFDKDRLLVFYCGGDT
jgi:hypothetical protein